MEGNVRVKRGEVLLVATKMEGEVQCAGAAKGERRECESVRGSHGRYTGARVKGWRQVGW